MVPWRVAYEMLELLRAAILNHGGHRFKSAVIGLDQTTQITPLYSRVVSRAGANSIAEIGLWKKPAILIPIPESISHDQRMNAYAYAKTGAAIVLDEENLTQHILVSEIERILNDPELSKRMGASAEGFTDPDAARILANQVLAVALPHES